MANSKMFVLLLGEKTKYLTKFVKWEVEHAIYLNLPIIVVNLNGNRNEDSQRMPTWLNNEICICCSCNAKIMQYSLEHWGDYHYQYQADTNKKGKHYSWKDTVYDDLGL